jgi:DNA-binding protein H-NS
MDDSTMPKLDLETMDFDELWLMHEQLTKILSDRITAEKLELEKRLARLKRAEAIEDPEMHAQRPTSSGTTRRKYPRVLPKYYNPLDPTETWSGRGKQPRWLVTALKAGRKLEELKIDDPEKFAVPT